MTLQEKELIIINHFGIESQKRKLLEEFFELIEAIIQFEDGTGNIENVIEEFGDTQVLLDQFKLHYEIDDEEIINSKIDKVNRTIERIKNGYYN